MTDFAGGEQFMDLVDYYLKNVKESDYYYRFYEDVVSTAVPNKTEFFVCDEIEAIDKFKKLCNPAYDASFSEVDICWFRLVCYFLNAQGYVLKEFPNLLSSPPIEPSAFTYDEIRKSLFAQKKNKGSTIQHAVRRDFVSKFTFERRQSIVDVGADINRKFIEVSTRNASFDMMPRDEKLEMIANLIENMLKQENSFIKLDYAKVCCTFITDDQVKAFRKSLHCFRHGNEESLKTRKEFTDGQKDFLIDYGLVIIKAVHALLNCQNVQTQ